MRKSNVELFNEWMDEVEVPNYIEEPLILSPVTYKTYISIILYRLGVWLSKI